ncbi:phBC6A51 family helix-turn-helix protein [Rossellomorea marisflavi]|uniref:phBC6A51 family helix-turn-helix protein n=1 Tax=Rossellomorea marisflavi TaxID=189381 RepID=UPI0009A73342|nr:phBC6A51 family helix-turn-helix protein [Rossellomorea marisflavi]
MANKHNFKYDESKFQPKQREAAIALVEYEFTPKGQRKTKEEIAEDLGVDRKTLYNWDNKDPNFIAYKNYLASEFMDSHLAFVYKKLIDSIERGSTRGIELYLKRIGDLDQNSEITIKQDGGLSFEERKAALQERISKAKQGGE